MSEAFVDLTQSYLKRCAAVSDATGQATIANGARGILPDSLAAVPSGHKSPLTCHFRTGGLAVTV
ncbi:hypothetical protein K3757_11140 [Sulfitobacter sp. S223]|uniref:hypothetical protein n=1 Tax=Sulfitobacter sp. S223 TaxID=2867023 RepID=UPI0021A273B4|nr:hypothetical protein [Sulfitobacter sp. S223]UWR25031.1 hypothetical protein K3757_11140 [Sulfitobacter sp. S223]